MEFLSVITKGTTEDKLQWAFTFYDVNHDGVISREELIRVKKKYVVGCETTKFCDVWPPFMIRSTANGLILNLCH